MTDEDSIVGYYGKVPTKGDFITHGLPRNFIDPWDTWLREVLAHSKSELGENWMEYYLTTPLYQYSFSSGICGNQNWLGVIMPSVDSVGRYFPMTICKSFSKTSNPIGLLEKNKQWLARAEELLLSCLDENFSLTEFEKNITLLKEEENNESTITLKNSTMNRYQDSAWNFPVHENEQLSVVYPELLNSMLKTFYSTYSIWHTSGSDLIASGYVISEGFPPYQSMPAFMDGQWKKWEWNDEQIIR